MATSEHHRRTNRQSDAGRAHEEAPPASGWAIPGSDEDPRAATDQLDALVAALGALRELAPPDLQHRLAEAVRELLIAVRALLDWYIQRLDDDRPALDGVEDIPIS